MDITTANRLAWIASSLHKRAHEIHLLMVLVGGLLRRGQGLVVFIHVTDEGE